MTGEYIIDQDWNGRDPEYCTECGSQYITKEIGNELLSFFWCDECSKPIVCIEPDLAYQIYKEKEDELRSHRLAGRQLVAQ
jgi:hypothetical protein